MQRLFLAINLPQEVKNEIANVQAQVQKQMKNSKVTWVSPENFHITLHFLGQVSEETMTRLVEDLKQTVFPKPFEMVLEGVSAFPNKKDPKIIFVQAKFHPDALGLHTRTAKILAGLGLKLDQKPWSAHITIGRVKVRSEVLQPEKIQVEPLSFPVSSIELMSSTLTANGSIYETVDKFPL